MNKKKLLIYLGLAFGISWLFALVIFLTGQINDSPELIPGTGITLAFILSASGYMWGPALAHILTRLILKLPWEKIYLKPGFRKNWKYLIMGWFLPGIFSILGAVVFFIIFPGFFDRNMSFISAQIPALETGTGITPVQVIVFQTLFALVISAPINTIGTFGEEFGWRGFLLPELLPVGEKKALIISSLIWGVWHWPMILMGHNYGLDYWGYPLFGLLITVWFTLSVGIFFGWLSLKGKSIWPAVLAHGSLNGLASIGMLLLDGTPPLLLGPSPAGIIGCLPFSIISLWILLRENTATN